MLFLYILQENEQDRRQAYVGDIVPFNKKFFIPSKHRHAGQSSVSRYWSTISISPRGEEHSSTREAAQALGRSGEEDLHEVEDPGFHPHTCL